MLSSFPPRIAKILGFMHSTCFSNKDEEFFSVCWCCCGNQYKCCIVGKCFDLIFLFSYLYSLILYFNRTNFVFSSWVVDLTWNFYEISIAFERKWCMCLHEKASIPTALGNISHVNSFNLCRHFSA